MQQAAQMLATLNVTPALTHFFPSLNQPILQTLMVSLAMIVAEVGMDGSAQHVLAKEDHPVQAFFPQAPPKPHWQTR
jgi:hypothetical protein